MISGIPPFQSKSEYMIFKKIEKLEYSFHEGFDEQAKDLVKRLLGNIWFHEFFFFLH